MEILRQAIQELGQNFVSMIDDGDDTWKKDLKIVEKIEEKASALLLFIKKIINSLTIKT